MLKKAQGLPYDTAFYLDHAQSVRASAAGVVPFVNSLVRPRSILDVGCGTGSWLAEWISCGITDVIGIDGDYVDRSQLHILENNFISSDLRLPFVLNRKFDLVESLEVAEHLDEKYADTFVESLARHGDVVLFSAAIPQQGGKNHVNERWQSYWVEKFGTFDFDVYDLIRPRIWQDQSIAWWYRQNMMLFSRLPLPTNEWKNSDVMSTIDVVHPDLWLDRNDASPPLKELLRRVPDAIRSAIQWRLRSWKNLG